MVKKCLEKNCNKIPNFNFETEKIAIYCKKHSKENMINVKSKKCLECTKQSNFNFETEKTGIYCKKHSKENMINVKSKKCLEQNCNKIPNYNLSNKKTGIYCFKHKKENMVDIKNKKCFEENCNIEPLYNSIGEKYPIYCKKHKKESMVDIRNKKCLEKNCYKRATFNLPNEKSSIYCTNHKKEGMIIRNKKICEKENCTKTPCFNFESEKVGIYCLEHKKEGMVDVNHKKCKQCNNVRCKNKYKGYCLRCFINLFPHQKISRNYKVKENYMTDFIKKEFKNEIMIFDKQTGGCSKRRPDCYIDKFTHVIIIECDENQHKDTNCENKRTMELFQDFGNRPIIFIRFNPDSYMKNNKKINSSFKMHKSLDVPIIKNNKEWDLRLALLKETINKFLETIPEKEITNEYLFYDQ